jgi:hypothetical protein
MNISTCYEYILDLIQQKEISVHVELLKWIFLITIQKLHIPTMISHSILHILNSSVTKGTDKHNAKEENIIKYCVTMRWNNVLFHFNMFFPP